MSFNDVLYFASVDYRNLLEHIDSLDGELTDEIEEQERKLADIFVRETDGAVEYLRSLEAKKSEVMLRIEEFEEIAQAYSRKIESVKNSFLKCSKICNQTKFKGTLHSITVKAPSKSVSIQDENKIPIEFIKIEEVVKIDKAAIKKRLSSGEVVAGACLVDGKESLLIK